MSKFSLKFPSINNQGNYTIASGQIVFLVGANGTGKSTLMYQFAKKNSKHVRRIIAHRQVWFDSNSNDMTPREREYAERNIMDLDIDSNSRQSDRMVRDRSQAMVFDLINSENIDARKIADAVKSDNAEEVQRLKGIKSPISDMNDILKMSNFDFQVEMVENNTLNAIRDKCSPYSIAELSDGERNALLIIAEVLTVSPNTLILIDEPERHLHRSIVSPLLSALLAYKGDCAFVISTHDVSLPLNQPKCGALLARKYSHRPRQWLVDYVDTVEDMDEEISLAILGSRSIIICIEGTSSSIDLQIYRALFPFVSIRSVGSCNEVERIVKGIRSSKKVHWVSAFGIIDRDNRTDKKCKELRKKGIIPLTQYSVESLYYHPETIRAIIRRVKKFNGIDIEFSKVVDCVVKEFCKEKDQCRMAAILSERRVRDLILSEIPVGGKIFEDNVEIKCDPKKILEKEKQHIKKLVKSEDIAGLISRYPAHKTQALVSVAKCLKFQSRIDYEQTVQTMLYDDEEAKKNMLNLIKDLTNAIGNAG